MARCNRKQLKSVLRHIGCIASFTAAACWRDFTWLLHGSSTLPAPFLPHSPSWMKSYNRAPITGILALARTTDKHRVPSSMLRQDADRACYIAHWGRRVGGTLCSTLPGSVLCVLFYLGIIVLSVSVPAHGCPVFWFYSALCLFCLFLTNQ